MQSSGSKTKRPRKNANTAKAEATATVTASEEAPKPARKSPSKTPAAAKQHRGSAKKAPNTRAERNVIEPELPVVTVPTGRMSAESAAAFNVPTVPETVIVQETAPVPEAETAPLKVAAATASYADVELLAYSYWVERGYQEGSPEEDWVRAEEALRSRQVDSKF